MAYHCRGELHTCIHAFPLCQSSTAQFWCEKQHNTGHQPSKELESILRGRLIPPRSYAVQYFSKSKNNIETEESFVPYFREKFVATFDPISSGVLA